MKENPILASVVISFYNKIDYLNMILASLSRQSFMQFEVVIADDGSNEDVVKAIQKIQSKSPFQIQHVWHEDIGFRKTTILNEAIRKSASDYLIFIDGDCIPHRKFVEEHYRNKQVGFVLAGRRVNLSEKISKQLSTTKIEAGYLDNGFTRKIIFDSILGDTNHVIKGVYVKSRWLRKFLNRNVTGILGCNFSIHKKDMVGINGFDERYLAPAVGEDTDIEIRLGWSGVSVRMIKNMAVQYHIYHKKLKRSTQNDALFSEIKESKVFYTPFGLNKV